MAEANVAKVEQEPKSDKKEPKFTAESGLGFMRVIQVLNFINIFFTLTAMIFVTGSKTPIDFWLVELAFGLISQAWLIWLIARRKMYTRQIAIAIYVINLVLEYITSIHFGHLNLFYAINITIMPALVIIYFITSRRAKAVLVQPFDIRFRDKSLAEGRKMWDPKSLDFWLRLLIYFFVFSVVGHWMEMGVQVLVSHGIIPGTIASPTSLTWRDNLNPFFIYGIAFAICGLVLYPIYLKLRQKIHSELIAHILSFLCNALFCVIAELILGMLFNADHTAWDYSNQPFNFMGQICLLYSFFFGILSSVITWLVYPFFERQFSYVSKDIFRAIFVASAVIFALLYFLYNVDLVSMGFLPAEDSYGLIGNQ